MSYSSCYRNESRVSSGYQIIKVPNQSFQIFLGKFRSRRALSTLDTLFLARASSTNVIDPGPNPSLSQIPFSIPVATQATTITRLAISVKVADQSGLPDGTLIGYLEFVIWGAGQSYTKLVTTRICVLASGGGYSTDRVIDLKIPVPTNLAASIYWRPTINLNTILIDIADLSLTLI